MFRHLRPRFPLLRIAVILCVSCSIDQEKRVFPIHEIAEGDLAFRCGHGVFSRVVTTTEEDGIYSHMGIIVKEAGKWKVVHSVPGERENKGDFDRVKVEDLDIFFADDRACKGCLIHTGLNDSTKARSLCLKAIQSVKDSIRFDKRYDLNDSSEVYCTEFVWRLYLCQGIDLSEGRRRYINAFHIKGDIILPEHIYSYSNNVMYYSF